ncbi:NRDE family protein [Aestuariibacter salexigens]|uniref:NRDE family protein n=1 Tax=Aestuariibacter salexigens TaxID=226010 RepID=UPI00040A1BF4|nr:NRDE family protein [Aestuariibacter salexigens]
MCIVFLAVNQHPDYPLILAANRDEFFTRGTKPSGFWPEHPELLAGRDLQAGGTWMGVTRNGKIAALTNIRDPQRIDPNATSRGVLTTDYLLNNIDENRYEAQLINSRQAFNGYNLLYGQWHDLRVYNNHLNRSDKLGDGFHGLSNAYINSPWPKINRGVNNLRQCVEKHEPISVDELFELLKDTSQADPELLPDTGIPIEWEQRLSSIFILGEEYGTRSSTVLLIDRQRHVHWHERSYNNQAQVFDTKAFQFRL